MLNRVCAPVLARLIQVKQCVDKNMPRFTMEIISPGSRTYRLVAQSEGELQEWTRLFREETETR